MKNKPVNLKINYLGISKPNKPSEIEFEILGLKSAIREAQYKIAQLEQGLALARLITEEDSSDSNSSES